MPLLLQAQSHGKRHTMRKITLAGVAAATAIAVGCVPIDGH